MTKDIPTSKNDSSEETVIGFKGSEQHHDLKNKSGEKADPDHAEGEAAAEGEIKQAVENANDSGAVSDALKDAVKK